jgi:hypothetical protein
MNQENVKVMERDHQKMLWVTLMRIEMLRNLKEIVKEMMVRRQKEMRLRKVMVEI